MPDVATRTDLAALEEALGLLLPADYHGAGGAIEPKPMRAAPLRFDADGNVAWDRIWGSFCDLALAGGPPHKGSLLEPATREQVAAEPDRYDAVVYELRRGIAMATELEAKPSPAPGWVRVSCLGPGMAGWLLRAIVMENVAVRSEASWIELPASPRFRLEKETKNVVTVIAKTCHYWLGHMPREQRDRIGRFVAEAPSPVAPDYDAPYLEPATIALAASIERAAGLVRSPHRYHAWLGVECADVRAAVWTMRALVVSNVLARREGTALLVPVNPRSDPEGALVTAALARVRRLASLRER